jgi:hypothetical protein
MTGQLRMLLYGSFGSLSLHAPIVLAPPSIDSKSYSERV